MTTAGDDVPDHLACSVCLAAPRGRVESCRNGHALCAQAGDGSCLAKLRRHAREQGAAPRCPSCRCPLPEELTRCIVAEQAIALLPATARYRAEARSAISERGELAAHAASYACAAVRCAGCAWQGSVGERAAHEASCALIRLQTDVAHARGLLAEHRPAEAATKFHSILRNFNAYEISREDCFHLGQIFADALVECVPGREVVVDSVSNAQRSMT